MKGTAPQIGDNVVLSASIGKVDFDSIHFEERSISRAGVRVSSFFRPNQMCGLPGFLRSYISLSQFCSCATGFQYRR